ncbi:MAG: hypothetical protein WCJ09_21175 [Planctomycetota bacterium]
MTSYLRNAFLLILVCTDHARATENNIGAIIDNCLRNSDLVHSCRLKGKVTHGVVAEASLWESPGRHQPLAIIMEDHSESYFFEDRLDMAHGRALLTGTSGNCDKAPEEAYVWQCPLGVHLDKLSQVSLRIDRIWDEIVSAVRPAFAGFDILKMLATHPDTRMRSDGRSIVLEIPLESLAEFSELGARVWIDPDRDYTLSGIDLYTNCLGKEVLCSRTDIQREHREGLWVVNRMDTWNRIEIPVPVTQQTRTRTSRLDIDWGTSTVNRHLSQ